MCIESARLVPAISEIWANTQEGAIVLIKKKERKVFFLFSLPTNEESIWGREKKDRNKKHNLWFLWKGRNSDGLGNFSRVAKLESRKDFLFCENIALITLKTIEFQHINL
jgi:hypothetical protein